jgi:hypothetical protein
MHSIPLSIKLADATKKHDQCDRTDRALDDR